MRALGRSMGRTVFWLLLLGWVWLWVLILRDSGILVGVALGSPMFWVLVVAVLVSAWPLARIRRWAYRR